MRIGIDAKSMYPEASGIGRYTIEMIKALSMQKEAKEHDFILYPGKFTKRIDLPDNWKYAPRTIASSGTIRALLFHLTVRRDKLDIFYSSDFLGPVFPMPCKTIITVYDLIPIVYPKLTSFKHRITGSLLLPHSIKNASSIISISQATKDDIYKYIDNSKNNIKVIYLGKNPTFRKIEKAKRALDVIRNKYGINKREYILFLGYLDPRKNLMNIIKAFSMLEADARKNNVLVIAGNVSRENPLLRQLINDLHLSNDIIFTGFIDDEDLSLLYNGARAFCFPSLYEGFGLPVLEAMACGCPVITSNISSLPEVAGEAALFVDPMDNKQISDAMRRLLADDKLFKELKAKGIKQAAKFSWDSAARELLQLFKSV